MSRGRGPGFMAGALFGGLVGGAVGVLLAPRSGAETRRELRERGSATGASEGTEAGSEPLALLVGALAAAQERVDTAIVEARAAAAEARQRLTEEWEQRKAGHTPTRKALRRRDRA